MKRPLDPPGWNPDLVPEIDRKVKDRLRARRKRQRDEYAEKARARDALKPKKPLRVPRTPRDPSRPKAVRKSRRRKGRAIGRHAWMRMLIVAYCAQGPFRVSDISRALGSDPYTVGQLVKGLQDSGVLPSKIGRTPIRRQA